MNKKKNVLYILMFMLICISIIFIWNYKGSNEYKLDEVELKNNIKINNKNLAIMVQKEDEIGYEEVDTFPSGLTLDTALSGCIDKNGEEINGAINYNVETMNLKIKSKGSSYCYLYFVRDNESPVITINTIDNYYTSAKLSILSNEDGTYCINTSNVSKDTSNCVLEGTLSENSMIVTKMFTESNTYYAHIKDNAGNETMSEALDIKVLYQKVEYIETTGTQYIDSGVKATNSSIDFTLQFTNNSISQGIIGARVSSSTISDRFNLFLVGSKLRLDWRGISNYGESNVLNINEDICVKLNQDRSININENYYSSSVGNIALNLDLFIGNFNENGLPWTTGAYAKWKTVKMYTSRVLVRDFIPVYRTSDNVIGLFDEVNKVFYTNAGSGTFGKGSNVS